MAKSLEQINREYYSSQRGSEGQAVRKKQKITSFLSNLIFYGALLLLLGTVVTYTIKDNTERSLAGYTVFRVLSGSMESVYPKGSMVLVKEVDASQIKVGDDITFMMNETATATHRVIEITENYDGNQRIGFRTQGTENANPDQGYVDERNVIGKAIFCIPMLGLIMELAFENIKILLVIFVLLIILSRALRELIGNRSKQEVVIYPEET